MSLNLFYGAALGSMTSNLYNLPFFNCLPAGILVNHTISIVSDPLEDGIKKAYNVAASTLNTIGTAATTVGYIAASGALYSVIEKAVPSHSLQETTVKMALSATAVTAVKLLAIDPTTRAIKNNVHNSFVITGQLAELTIWLGKFALTTSLSQMLSKNFSEKAILAASVALPALYYGAQYIDMKKQSDQESSGKNTLFSQLTSLPSQLSNLLPKIPLPFYTDTTNIAQTV